jgi:ABC-type transport system substrate-binding protein
MSRRTLVTLLAAALAFGSIATAQTTVEGYPGLGMVPGTPGGTLTLALGDSPPRFFYYGEISAISQALTMQMFDPLIYLDLETYELIPGLARDWSVSDDGLVYTLHLREGVTGTTASPSPPTTWSSPSSRSSRTPRRARATPPPSSSRSTASRARSPSRRSTS